MDPRTSLLNGMMSRLVLSGTRVSASTPSLNRSFARSLSTTQPLCKAIPHQKSLAGRLQAAKNAKAAKMKGRKPTNSPRKKQVSRSENYVRLKILKQNMFSPAPPPLRMARLRHLRHWTIHRAWMLFRRKQKEATERERERMHWGMYNACEELRTTALPGSRDEGYLYRVAMEKKGVWGVDGFPIEYARGQTDAPATKAWNHEWKRAKDV